jgi:hypothetical protein
MSKSILPAAVVAVAFLTCTLVSAETIQLTRPDSGGNAVVIKNTADPFADQWITQSVDPCTIVDGTSVACAGAVTNDTHGWRLFDLDADHGLAGDFCVESIDYAVQSFVGDEQYLTANVYCLDDGLPFVLENLDLVGTQTVPQTDYIHLEFFNIEVSGCCEADSQSMVVELASASCLFVDCIAWYIGMNDLGQTAPTYYSEPDCGVVDPIDLATVGFPNAHLIMVVHGADDGGTGGGSGDPCAPDDDGGDPDVPATTGVGATLLLLILLGSGAYFLRGRAAT